MCHLPSKLEVSGLKLLENSPRIILLARSFQPCIGFPLRKIGRPPVQQQHSSGTGIGAQGQGNMLLRWLD